MQTKSQQKALLLTILVAAIGCLLVMNRHRHSSTNDSMRTPKLQDIGIVQAPKRSPGAHGILDSSGPKDALKAGIKLAKAEGDAGLFSFSLAPASQGRHPLQVTVSTVQSGCSNTSLSAILADLRHRKQDNVLFTVEPLDQNHRGPPLIGRKLSLANLGQNFSFQTVIPQTAVPLTLGVYLCSDQQLTGQCAGKTVRSSDMIFPSKANTSASQKSSLSDAVYLANYLVQTASSLKLPSGSTASAKQMLGLERYLMDAGTAKDLAKSNTEQIKGMLKVLPSPPATATAQGLQINLPLLKTVCAPAHF